MCFRYNIAKFSVYYEDLNFEKIYQKPSYTVCITVFCDCMCFRYNIAKFTVYYEDLNYQYIYQKPAYTVRVFIVTVLFVY